MRGSSLVEFWLLVVDWCGMFGLGYFTVVCYWDFNDCVVFTSCALLRLIIV